MIKMIRKTLPPPCPYEMAHKAGRILAGLIVLTALGCSSVALPEALTPSQRCRRDVLVDALKGNAGAALDVLMGNDSLREALIDAGLSQLEADSAVAKFLSCEPLQAMPPAYGNKVL